MLNHTIYDLLLSTLCYQLGTRRLKSVHKRLSLCSARNRDQKLVGRFLKIIGYFTEMLGKYQNKFWSVKSQIGRKMANGQVFTLSHQVSEPDHD